MCEKVYQEMELRRGPWTLEEDTLLIHYIACHGEGRWNLLARCSGLRRTGKSCRLRWLNYLKPDIKRGNLSPEEQLLILELHCKWGNRWSRIAQYLPGRTDNEIKNYWRTRVQKQARQLRVDANSATFRDAVRCYWMPRLLQKSCGNWAAASAYTDDHHQSRYNYTPLQPSALPLPEEEQVLMFQCQRLENTTTSCAANAGASFSQSLPVNCLPQFSSEVVDSPGGDSSILPAAAAAGIELNQYSQIPFHSTSASSGYDIAATAPVSTAISYSSSSSSSSSLISHPATNCTTTSSSVVDHDGLWSNMDQELYAMLNSYMDGVEYANMFPLGDVPLRDELT